MSAITAEKLTQAAHLVRETGVGAWLTFVRETSGGGDPILPLVYEGGLTWMSALLVFADGEKVAVVGNYDADPLVASGDWDRVLPYVQSIKEPLLGLLEEKLSPGAKIAINYSKSDDKSDGLSHGMYLALSDYLSGSPFRDSLVSAAEITSRLRGQKTPTELNRMQSAIEATDRMFEEIQRFAAVGVSERAVYDHVHRLAKENGYGFSWDPVGDPIVNSGPNSMIGHGIPSDSIKIEPGHIFHVDLGLVVESYSSDLQRIWFVGDGSIPEDVLNAFQAVRGALLAGFGALVPGVCGYEVDAVARKFIVGAGFPEYRHALGHQVGRMAHDGGTILGPCWERYGMTPLQQVLVNEVYTIELGVTLEGRGYLGLEEMAIVSETGAKWLSKPQDTVWRLGEVVA